MTTTQIPQTWLLAIRMLARLLTQTIGTYWPVLAIVGGLILGPVVGFQLMQILEPCPVSSTEEFAMLEMVSCRPTIRETYDVWSIIVGALVGVFVGGWLGGNGEVVRNLFRRRQQSA